MSETSSLTFSSFVLSLAATAAIHFGDLADATTGGKRDPDLPAAAQIIEILALLLDKTRSNLADDEQRLLSQTLYELRMRYIEASKGQGS